MEPAKPPLSGGNENGNGNGPTGSRTGGFGLIPPPAANQSRTTGAKVKRQEPQEANFRISGVEVGIDPDSRELKS